MTRLTKSVATVLIFASLLTVAAPIVTEAQSMPYTQTQHNTVVQIRMFDSKWWIEKFVLPLMIAILMKSIEVNYNSLVRHVYDGLGWAGRFVKHWMIDDAATQTCDLVAQGYAENLVRANMVGASEEEIQQAIYNITINCAGINELYQIA